MKECFPKKELRKAARLAEDASTPIHRPYSGLMVRFRWGRGR